MAKGIAFTPSGTTFGANTNANVTIDASHATDALALPVGTTGQRPAGGKGMIRFNSNTSGFEGFIASWAPLGGGQVVIQNNNVMVNSTSTIDFSNGTNVILKVTDDYANGRVNVFFDSTGGGGGSINVAANAHYNVNSAANLNFNNTSTVNVTVVGVQGNTTANIAFTANQSAIAGPAYDQANAAYAQANAAYTQANTAETDAQAAIVIGEAAYAEANAAYARANNFAIDSNGTVTVANATSINFNNTATVNVATSANGSQGNVAFTANITAIVGPFAANANAAYAEANAAYAQANTQGTYANGTSVVANTSNINWNNTATMNVSVTANGTQSNVAWSANITSIVGPFAANTNAAYLQANTANLVAQTALGYVYLANAQAQAALVTARAAANTVAVFANGTLVLADSNLNFNNTSTMNVFVTANGTSQANISFQANVASLLNVISSINDYYVNAVSLGTQTTVNSAYTFYTVPSIGKGLVSIFNISSSNGAAQYDILVSGSPSISGTTFLMANSVVGNYNASFPWYYQADNPADTNMYIGLRIDAGAPDTWNVANLRIEQFALSPNIYSNLTSVIAEENFVATANQTAFTLVNPLAPANVNYLLVSRNGILLEPTTHYTLTGQVLTLSANSVTNDVIDVREFIAANTQQPSVILNEQFTSTANQTAFTLNNVLSPANVNYVMVFRNGLEQAPTTDYTLAGQTLTFTSNTLLNDLIEIREFIGMNLANGGFAAGANQQIQFNLNGSLAGDPNLIFKTTGTALSVGGHGAAGAGDILLKGANAVIRVEDSTQTGAIAYLEVGNGVAILDTTQAIGGNTAWSIRADGSERINISGNNATVNIFANVAITGNINVSATINTAANLVAGNISTPQNTSTGNLSVTQNTSTGNLSVTQNVSTGNLSASGVAVATSDLQTVSGNIIAGSAVTTNTQQRAFAGMSATMTGNSVRQSTTALTFENNLSMTINTTGTYKLEALLAISSGNGNTIHGAQGIKISWGGTATQNAFSYMQLAVINGGSVFGGFGTFATNGSNILTYATIQGGDFVLCKGTVTLNTTGTFIPMFAQVVSNANTTNLSSNSYMTLTRIG
jgi:hypothetical protein